MTLDTFLRARPGRCSGCGYHETQGCSCEGNRLKHAGQSATLDAHPDDRAKVDAAIRQLAATGREFSSNDARSIHGVKGAVVGAAFGAAARSGLIVKVGFVASTEPGTHAHPVATWRGAASVVDRPASESKPAAAPRSSASAWDDREEGSTWIDRL